MGLRLTSPTTTASYRLGPRPGIPASGMPAVIRSRPSAQRPRSMHGRTPTRNPLIRMPQSTGWAITRRRPTTTPTSTTEAGTGDNTEADASGENVHRGRAYSTGANDDGTISSGNELGSTTGAGPFSTVDCQLYRSLGNGNNPGRILGISPLFRVQPNPPAKSTGFTATVGDG